MDTEKARSITPMFIGEGANSNRTRGGLWNTATAAGSVAKSGHIEPRKTTSLTGVQMGGASSAANASISKPYVSEADKAEKLFAFDTVSGDVVLRGYVEDDQRIERVELRLVTTTSPITTTTVIILDYYNNSTENTSGSYGAGTPGNNGNYEPPRTGLLQVPAAQNGKVYFTDTIDLYRHRVEWAYIWETELVPANTIVGNVNVRVVAYNRNSAAAVPTSYYKTSPEDPAPGTAHTNTSLTNTGFPLGLNKYNSINMNIRPYITGITHEQYNTNSNARSRQGRYRLYGGYENIFIIGFNLGGLYNSGIAARVYLPGADGIYVNKDANGWIWGDYYTDENLIDNGFDVATARSSKAPMRIRNFSFYQSDNAVTGDGVVLHSVTRSGAAYQAVNTGAERARAPNAPARPLAILPWNTEYSPGIEGSELWDDFTQVHIWRAGANVSSGEDRDRFTVDGAQDMFDPSLSIDPATGTLWASYNQNKNSSAIVAGSNDGKGYGLGGNLFPVAMFSTPIINSDIFISPRPSGYYGDDNAFTVWTAYSVTGRSNNPDTGWRDYGGVFINGPNGARGVNIANNGEHDVDSTVEDFVIGDYQMKTPDGSQLASGIALSGNTNNGFIYPNPSAYYFKDSVIARSQYLVESAGYNAGAGPNNDNYPPGNLTNPPTINQFKNPHIITHWDGADEHIHVSYYDDKDGSLKYRYNRRGSAGNIYGRGTSDTDNPSNNMPYAWTNLDGGYDLDDRNPFNAPTNTGWDSANGGGYYIAPWNSITNPIGQNDRIVNWAGRVKTEGRGANIDAGEHNSIALNSQGYPVVAYMDKTNQKLKLAVSNSTVPIAASAWTIIPDVIPAGSGFGIGQYVSMKIDTRVTPNIVHIAAMDSLNKNLVYVRGTLSGTTYTNTNVQVVDSLGSVGRYCTLSLDAEGNPWISYLDEVRMNIRDAVKLAYYNPDLYYKGGDTHYTGEDTDIYGASLNGWEVMHIPTLNRVANCRLGMECYPTRNYTGPLNPASRFWSGAVAYQQSAHDFNGYYIAYYLK
jgi:hypothetical protein